MDAWASAVKALGGEYDRDATTIAWYGRFLNDWRSQAAAVNRIDPKRFGKSDAGVVRFPGVKYTMGLLKNADGSYTPYFDAWGEGRKLAEKLGGLACPKLKDEYAAAVSTRLLARRGFRVTRTTNKQGEIELQVRG